MVLRASGRCRETATHQGGLLIYFGEIWADCSLGLANAGTALRMTAAREFRAIYGDTGN